MLTMHWTLDEDGNLTMRREDSTVVARRTGRRRSRSPHAASGPTWIGNAVRLLRRWVKKSD